MDTIQDTAAAAKSLVTAARTSTIELKAQLDGVVPSLDSLKRQQPCPPPGGGGGGNGGGDDGHRPGDSALGTVVVEEGEAFKTPTAETLDTMCMVQVQLLQIN